MKKHFFSHLIEIDALEREIDNFELSATQKKELKDLIHENIYHTVLDAILSELSENDKKTFLSHLVSDDNEKIWGFVNKKVLFIEEKIKKAADEIKIELHKEIKESKK
jgi:hypothetical protein